MTLSKVLFSSEKQDWGTPPELFQKLDQEFGPFMLDAATIESNPLGAMNIFTEKDNALTKSWMDPTYCNPPYGHQLGKWVKKAYVESCLGNLVVMFIPARTDTIWFHNYIYNRPKSEVRFIKGRIRMFDYSTNNYAKNVAPFPSMIVVFRP